MVSVDFAKFRLICIYMPNMLAKIPYWEALIAALSSQSANRALAIGDFNTCRAYLDEAGAIDRTAHYMDAIERIGFRDLWRQRYPERREYSWFSTKRNGRTRLAGGGRWIRTLGPPSRPPGQRRRRSITSRAASAIASQCRSVGAAVRSFGTLVAP
jgi:hypothetical protein